MSELESDRLCSSKEGRQGSDEILPDTEVTASWG